MSPSSFHIFLLLTVGHGGCARQTVVLETRTKQDVLDALEAGSRQIRLLGANLKIGILLHGSLVYHNCARALVLTM